MRKLGSVDVGPQSTVGAIEVDLLKGETILPDPARFFRSRPPGWHNPLAEKDGQPGVAFQWLEVEGPLYEAWPTRGQRLLCGDLPLKESGTKGSKQIEIVSENPDRDGARLVRGFMQRALRRPVQEADVQPFVKLFHTAQQTGANFTESLLTAYTGILCSPAFVTLEESPGLLDGYALASRLSYFLWNSEPDDALRSLAAQGALRNPQALAAQTNRMLADPRSQWFMSAFLDYWLDLRKTGNTSPDETLYPDYYLDDYLTESALEETRAFFTEMLRGDLPARNLVASDFVMVNQRLAELYGSAGMFRGLKFGAWPCRKFGTRRITHAGRRLESHGEWHNHFARPARSSGLQSGFWGSPFHPRRLLFPLSNPTYAARPRSANNWRNTALRRPASPATPGLTRPVSRWKVSTCLAAGATITALSATARNLRASARTASPLCFMRRSRWMRPASCPMDGASVTCGT